MMTEFTTCTPYTATELRELGKQCRQRPGEPIPAWLRLWHEGADSIICLTDKIEKLAFIMVHPSLRQRLQNSHRFAQGQGNHSLMEGLTAAVCSVD